VPLIACLLAGWRGSIPLVPESRVLQCALAARSTASDLQGILGLPFQATPAMIIGIILGGGTVTLALDWWLTVKSVERAYGSEV